MIGRLSRGRGTVWILGLALAAVGSLSACSTPTVSTSAGVPAASAPATGATLSPAEFAAAAKLPDTVLLDVRTPAEFAAGHLPGATNIDVESAGFATAVNQLDPSKTYAIYCRSGNRSKAAMTTLQQAGFTSVFHLGGGITSWQAAGGEVTTG